MSLEGEREYAYTESEDDDEQEDTSHEEEDELDQANQPAKEDHGKQELEDKLKTEKDVIKRLMSLKGISLVPGEYYNVLDKKWWRNWSKYVGYDYNSGGSHPGLINNAFLLEEDGINVKRNAVEDTDFVFVPKDVWDKFHEWYGGGPVICRKCQAVNRRTFVEVRPLLLRVLRSRRLKKFEYIKISKVATVQEFIDMAKTVMTFDAENIRVFDFHKGRKLKLLDNMSTVLAEVPIIDEQDMLIEERTKAGTWPNDKIYARFAGQATVAPTPNGLTGLLNLGNTCFMAAAIQCLSQTVPLVDFFMSGDFRKDINRDNPLGQKGELAEQFEETLKELWSSSTGIHEPRLLKKAIEKCDARFAGYQQHDSQELLVFLLDGIHEDLNRIKKKPYVEKVEGAGLNDTEIAKLSWEGHKARNDSIVVDYFQGQLKSTLTCPINGRVSTTFDPFMYLTVPIPVRTTRKVVVKVYYMKSMQVPEKFGVMVEKEAKISELLTELCKLTDIHPSAVVLVEVLKDTFRRRFYPDNLVSEISGHFPIHAHQIVPSLPPPLKADNRGKPPSRPPPPLPAVPAAAEPPAVPAAAEPPAVPAAAEPPAVPAAAEPPAVPAAAGPPAVPAAELTAAPAAAELPSQDAAPAAGMPTAVDTTASQAAPSTSSASSAVFVPSAGNEVPQTTGTDSTQVDEQEAEDSDDEYDYSGLPENHIVHLPVLLKHSSLFGTPFIISVPRNISYERLYAHIIERIAYQLKQIPKREEDSSDEEGSAPSYYTIFDVLGCKLDGSDPYDLRKDDESDSAPLKLKEQQPLLLQWTWDYFKQYYDERKEKDYYEHRSVDQREEPKKANIQECLKLFTKEEQLGADDPWYCSDCKEMRQAFKRFDIWSCPPILIIHLKRFSYRSGRFQIREKLDHLIEFPLEGLDLSEFIIGPKEVPPIYDLYAVSNHMGTMTGGHYTAYGRHRDNNKWYRFDDSNVSEVSPGVVQSSYAYVLFYKRKDLPWGSFDKDLDKLVIDEYSEESSDEAPTPVTVKREPQVSQPTSTTTDADAGNPFADATPTQPATLPPTSPADSGNPFEEPQPTPEQPPSTEQNPTNQPTQPSNDPATSAQ
eukprot:TRINITY_DN4398_c0_g1_i1.p1 TRINITY_DN4398_c0_g1~~TRINITY_DN4398_c0_g1_i1.p1  ORF type:complete len:1098 (+),score=233.90 TRINITY_DN4398_c0_g1_i1:166-3459(+)